MDNIPAKSDYDGVTIPAPADKVHSAAELNDRRVELQGAVTDSGQALAAADAGQLSKAMYANGVGASSMIDSGGANTVVLTPKTGTSGLRVATPVVPDYSLLDGAIFNFQANSTNTGNVTVNVGQTVGTLIGAQPLFLSDGSSDIPVNHIIAGEYYDVRYDSTLDSGGGAFVLFFINTGLQMREDAPYDIIYSNGANSGTINIVVDGNFNDVDLSSIVPVGAKVVIFFMSAEDDAINSSVIFRAKGTTGGSNLGGIATQTVGSITSGDATISLDSSRKVQLRVSPGTFATASDLLSIGVKGWWI